MYLLPNVRRISLWKVIINPFLGFLAQNYSTAKNLMAFSKTIKILMHTQKMSTIFIKKCKINQAKSARML